MTQPMHGRVTNNPDGREAIANEIVKDLVRGVLKIAIKDLGNEKPEIALDAAVFLAGPELPYFLAVAIDEDIDSLRDSGCKLLAGVQNENEKEHERIRSF